jgi:hypothetical protein
MSAFNQVRSSRRPAALKDSDYDHEISMIDETQSVEPSKTSPSPSRSRSASQSPTSRTTSRRANDAILRKKATLQKEIVNRRYSKYQDRRVDEESPSLVGQLSTQAPEATNDADLEGERGRRRTESPGRASKSKPTHNERETAIDILYENERGGFLCGIPLFSSKALGNLDPSAWTNVAFKTSATNITNAQVPDPSWEWVWKEWRVNHDVGTDEDGWEYSFAFSRKFSWHGPAWWNSFVRRRAWIRKRAKKAAEKKIMEAHILNSDYFTIHPTVDRSRSSSRIDSIRDSRYSILALAKQDMFLESDKEDICDIASLMVALKFARIDREKTEAVENFIENGGEDLYYLRERMHDIMAQFIFQEARRLLLTHLSRKFDQATEHREQHTEEERDEEASEKRRIDNLQAAIKCADEEVRRLEYWSDQRHMALAGDTKGAVDESQGWDKSWSGLDDSGPKDVISERNLPGLQRFATPPESTGPRGSEDKGKGKE